MKLNFLTGIVIFIASIILGCSNKPYREEKLVGLNDTAYYYFHPSTGKVGAIYKEVYMYDPKYSLSIEKDTILLGEEFHGYIGAHLGEYEIVIEEPKREIIEGVYQKPKSGEPYEPHVYSYKTTSKGYFNFRGRIEFDTLTIPFEFKFIVIDK